MQPDPGRLASKLRIATLAIVLAGSTAAAGAYLAATLGPQEPDAASRLETKQYRHDLEVFGGKANLLAADFLEWYDGLWHGTNLAVTIGFLTAVSAGTVRLLGSMAARRRDV